MGNRNNDPFDDDDGFLRDDDDDFSQFDDIDDSANLDDDLLGGLDDEPIILDDGEEPTQTERQRTSPVFIALAAIFIIILLGGLGLIAFLILNGGQTSEIDVTRTAIANINATTIADGQLTQTQSAVNIGLTATATLFTPTPTATLTPSPTVVDFTATSIASTEQAIAIAGTSTTIALLNIENANATGTAIASGQGGGDATPTPEVNNNVITPISVDAVNQTATALAGLLVVQEPTQSANVGGLATATRTVPTNGTGGGNTELPNTGLFDEVNTGTMSALAVVAFGLVGVIVFARRTRKTL
jgi:hypothetical protein